MVFGLGLFLWPSFELSSENFVFYFPNQSRVVPLQTLDNGDYLPLLDVLNLLGKVQGWEEKGKQLRVYFEGSELRLQVNDRKAKIGKTTRQLSRPVVVQNGQWMIPLDFLDVVLPQLTREPIEYHPGSRRAFVGGVKSNTFAAHLETEAAGAKLVLSFASPVSLRTASSNGKYILFLGTQPVEPQPVLSFQNPYAAQLQFDDSDGLPKFILTPRTAGLDFYTTTTAGGKTVIAELRKPPPAPAPAPVEPAATAAAPSAVPPEAPAIQAPPLPVVALDPGHGGEDPGARAGNGMQEKDLVSQLAEQVRAGLAATHKYQVVLTRQADTNPGLDDRDATANRSRPVAFLSFHAGNLGSAGAPAPRLRIYTFETADPAGMSAGNPSSQTLFLRWDTLQMARLGQSRTLGDLLKARLAAISGAVVAGPWPAPVRVLRSVDAPAVAIEVGSLAPGVDPAPLTDPRFQQQFAAAVVQAIEALPAASP